MYFHMRIASRRKSSDQRHSEKRLKHEYTNKVRNVSKAFKTCARCEQVSAHRLCKGLKLPTPNRQRWPRQTVTNPQENKGI